jgi:hypothetical protein
MISPTGKIINTHPTVKLYKYRHHSLEFFVESTSEELALAIGKSQDLDYQEQIRSGFRCRCPGPGVREVK